MAQAKTLTATDIEQLLNHINTRKYASRTHYDCAIPTIVTTKNIVQLLTEMLGRAKTESFCTC